MEHSRFAPQKQYIYLILLSYWAGKIIVQDDKKIINKILFGLEKTKLTDNNLTLVQTIEKAIKQTKCKG